MITLYGSGGARDFSIDESATASNNSQALKTAELLLRARKADGAADILRTISFRFFPATNHFGDEFNVLCATVPLETYERVRVESGQAAALFRYRQIADVLSELGVAVRFISLELAMASTEEGSDKLKDVEINKLVYKYIGVDGGYLGDFSYRTHHEFYIELDLDVDPTAMSGTTRERFTSILREGPPERQAKILEGVLARFPVGSSELRTADRESEIRIWIARLRGSPQVAAPSLRVSSEVVQRALQDAENLLKTSGATSGVDRVHTALHGYCIALCKEQGIVVADEAGMAELFKVLSQQHPAFADMGPRKEDILRILRALATILDTLNPIRNKTSVAHPNATLLPELEAVLVFNCVRTILQYLDRKTSAAAARPGAVANIGSQSC